MSGNWLTRTKSTTDKRNDILTQSDIQENIEIAIKLKEDGNNLFKEKNYNKAISQYCQIEIYIKSLIPIQPPSKSADSKPGQMKNSDSDSSSESDSDSSSSSDNE